MKKCESNDIFDIFDIKIYPDKKSKHNKEKESKSDKKSKHNKENDTEKNLDDDVFSIFNIKCKQEKDSKEKKDKVSDEFSKEKTKGKDSKNKVSDKESNEKKSKEKIKEKTKEKFLEKEKKEKISEKESKEKDFDENLNQNGESLKYEYPIIKYKYKCMTDPTKGPYGTSWVNDKNKKSDILTEEDKIRSKKVSNLMTIEYPPQRSKEWFNMRKSCISASDCGCVIGVNQHEFQYNFYIKKLTEPPFKSNVFCYHGTKLEEIATMVYEYRMDVKVHEFGLVKHPKIPFLGASPDGIVGKYKLDGISKTKFVGTMLEIKCPPSRKINENNPFEHIDYYAAQIQNQLECCDLDVCHFWQTKITEYKSRKDFIDDTDPAEPFRSKSFGMEKGCLIQLLPRDMITNLQYNNDEIIFNYSKFIYPPKIEMTPLDCDLWISETVNNIEQYLIDKILINYKDEIEDIKKFIKSGIFIIYYKNEIQKKTDEVSEWYVEKFKKNVSEPKKLEWFTKYANELIDKYYDNYTEKLYDNKFIHFIITCKLEGYENITDDPELIEKMINPDKDPEFYEKIKTDKNLLFIKNLSQMLRDLEYPKKYCFHRVYYWRIEKTHCQPVLRDKKWFADKLPIYQKIWDNITIMQNNPNLIELMLKYINSLPTVEKHYENEFKDNSKVMDFVDLICKIPKNEKEKKKYDQKIKEIMGKL
jgi:putative phage-type endonuclease